MTQSISVSVADLLISVYLMATGFVFYIED